ncbi:MAG: V-type ATP synthase subunit D [Desulfurococcaceae archaeon]
MVGTYSRLGRRTMSMLTRVRPTKIELIRLRRRLITSVRVHRILTERLVVLANEYMSRIREAVELRRRVQESSVLVYKRALGVLGLYGPSASDYLAEVSPKPTVYVGTENVMGVKVKSVVLKYSDKRLPSGLEDFTDQCRAFVDAVIALARAEYALREIGRELVATKRKANALQYIIIPRLRSVIRALQLKFDEREREEKSRLKRIKHILESRGSA